MSDLFSKDAVPYPGGIDAILAQLDKRRDPLRFLAGDPVPPADLDLAPLTRQTVDWPDPLPATGPRSRLMLKRHALAQEFAGQSQLALLNGLLIACLRKRSYPAHFPALFVRLWADQSDHLLEQLNLRWQVSSATTFGDVGLTPVQRSSGLSLSVLFGAMKLYESERLFSGLAPEQPYRFGQKIKSRLALDMDSFALMRGDADLNLLARLWDAATPDPVIQPLAHNLLKAVIGDQRTVFARLMAMRRKRDDRAIGTK